MPALRNAVAVAEAPTPAAVMASLMEAAMSSIVPLLL